MDSSKQSSRQYQQRRDEDHQRDIDRQDRDGRRNYRGNEKQHRRRDDRNQQNKKYQNSRVQQERDGSYREYDYSYDIHEFQESNEEQYNSRAYGDRRKNSNRDYNCSQNYQSRRNDSSEQYFDDSRRKSRRDQQQNSQNWDDYPRYSNREDERYGRQDNSKGIGIDYDRNFKTDQDTENDRISQMEEYKKFWKVDDQSKQRREYREFETRRDEFDERYDRRQNQKFQDSRINDGKVENWEDEERKFNNVRNNWNENLRDSRQNQYGRNTERSNSREHDRRQNRREKNRDFGGDREYRGDREYLADREYRGDREHREDREYRREREYRGDREYRGNREYRGKERWENSRSEVGYEDSIILEDREQDKRQNRNNDEIDWQEDAFDDIYVTEQNSGQPAPIKISCELSKYTKGRARTQKFNMIQDFLYSAKGDCSIEIIVKDLDKRFISWARQNQYKLREINLSFQYKQKSEVKRNLSQTESSQDIDQQQINSKTKEIFIFKDQNDIPGIYIMLLVFQTKYSTLYENAQKCNINFITLKQQAAIQLRTDQSGIQKLRQYLDENIKPIEKVYIIVHRCQTMNELKKKLLLLSKQKEKLQQFFTGLNWDNHIHCPLSLDTLFFQQEFDDQYIKEKLSEFIQLPVLYFLITATNQEGQKLQKNFDQQFINNPLVIGQKQLHLNLYFEQDLSNFESAKQEILELLKEEEYTYYQLIINDPVYEIQSKKWKVLLISILWVHDNLKVDDKKSVKLFKEATDILSGVQTMSFSEHKQIEIWKHYLKQKYENLGSVKKIQIQNYLNDSKQINLEIRSDINSAKDVDELRKQIQHDIETITINKAEIRASREILQSIQIDRFQKIFNQEINELMKQYPNTTIKFYSSNKKFYFSVYHNKEVNFQQLNDQVQKVIQQLRKTQIQVNLQKFFDFLKERTLNEFEEKYQIFMKETSQDQFNLVSFENHIARIEDLLKIFKSNEQKNYVDFEVDLENEVLFKHIMEKFSEEIKKYSIQTPKVIQFIIILNGEKEIIELLINEIENERQQFTQSLFTQKIILKQIQKQYLQKEKIQEIQDLKQKYGFLIDFQELKCSDQYIWSWEDENGRKPYSDEINQKIDLAYSEFLQDNSKNELILNYAVTHEPATHTVDLQRMTITDKQNNSKEKIQWKQQRFYYQNKPMRADLNSYLIEKSSEQTFKFDIFMNEYKIVFHSHQVTQINLSTNFIRKVSKTQLNKQSTFEVYKWDWLSEVGAQEFPKDISRQIDVGYQTYLNDKSQNSIILNYQPEHKPATHIVNLQTMTICEVTTKKEYPLKLSHNKYQFNRRSLKQEVNDYILDKRTKGEITIEIFLNEYSIYFSDSNIVQINLKTQFQRMVNKTLLKQPLKFKNQPEYELLIKSPSQTDLKTVYDSINQILQSDEQEIDLQIPQLKENQLMQLFDLIQNNVYKIQGEIQPNFSIKITAFNEGIKQLKTFLTACEQSSVQFPKEWIKQENQNLIKVLLQPTDAEYILVKQELEKTLQAEIKAIYRIQNKELFINYQTEKDKLIKRNKARNINLQKHEEERLLWHGVRYQHPKAIYQGNKEAFDVTYSNEGCLWGQGAYFAENASYSVNYSYNLQQNDDPQFTGMKVFLCCRVALGKSYKCEPNNGLKRPPLIAGLQNESFDSVTGFTNGSNVFILYSMDVRRAYPAYEVIYQQ